MHAWMVDFNLRDMYVTFFDLGAKVIIILSLHIALPL